MRRNQIERFEDWDAAQIEIDTSLADKFTLSSVVDPGEHAVGLAVGYEARGGDFDVSLNGLGISVGRLNPNGLRKDALHSLRHGPLTVNTDLVLTKKPVFEGDTNSMVGMSGGPFLDANDGVIGITVYGLPGDSHKKSTLGAVDLRALRAAYPALRVD